MQKVIQPEERKREARERRRRMEQEASNSRRRQAWEKIMGSASPHLVTVSCGRKLSRDVGLDVELAALVSSVETTLYFQLFSDDVSLYQQFPMQLLLSAHVSDCTRDSDRDWH